MNTNIVTLDLSFRRRSLIGYTIGMAVYTLVVVALYPAFKDSSNLDQLTTSASGVAALFGISGSITSPTGWISANVYANFFPLLVLLLTIGYGAMSLAGQEQDGHLELVMSAPFSRSRVVGEKIAALVIQSAVFCVVVFVSVFVGRGSDLSMNTANLATASIGVLLLGVDFGLLAMAIGGATGNRGLAVGIAAAVAAAAYLVSSLAPLVTWLKPARTVSLFYWSVGDNQLDNGLSPAGASVLLLTAVVLAIATTRLFDRHDLT